jgi:hypothetical protein
MDKPAEEVRRERPLVLIPDTNWRMKAANRDVVDNIKRVINPIARDPSSGALSTRRSPHDCGCHSSLHRVE